MDRISLRDLTRLLSTTAPTVEKWASVARSWDHGSQTLSHDDAMIVAIAVVLGQRGVKPGRIRRCVGRLLAGEFDMSKDEWFAVRKPRKEVELLSMGEIAGVHGPGAGHTTTFDPAAFRVLLRSAPIAGDAA